MKKLLILLGFAFTLQACAVYPPYGHSVVYGGYNYGYQPHRYYGWGGHHGWGGGHGWNGGRNGWEGGNNWGGHNGWGHGYH